MGAMPGVTRQVSAFRIASNPPLYLVDTPGVMVPRVESTTAGLFLALTRAVPDSVVPPDVLVGFMLRVVRTRRSPGARNRSVTTDSAPRATSRAGSFQVGGKKWDCMSFVYIFQCSCREQLRLPESESRFRRGEPCMNRRNGLVRGFTHSSQSEENYHSNPWSSCPRPSPC